MSNDTDESLNELPADINKRLMYWHGLWNSSAKYHYFFGVVSVAASVISTSLEGGQAKIFSIIAAIATALIGFMHPERRYMKFVRAWRVLDVAALRYRYGIIGKPELIDAVERGHALIAEYEDKYDSSADKKEGDKTGATLPPEPTPAPAGEAPTTTATTTPALTPATAEPPEPPAADAPR